MKSMEFQWNEQKNAINIAKHGIDFKEASTVFYDENAILFDDPEHSSDEDRFLILGYSKSLRLCIVSHCYREKDSIIHIISARKATKNETKSYHNFKER